MIIIVWVDGNFKEELPNYDYKIIGALTAKTHALRNEFMANHYYITCNYFKEIRQLYQEMYMELLQGYKFLLQFPNEFIERINNIPEFYFCLEQVFARVLKTPALRVSCIKKSLIAYDILEKLNKYQEKTEESY